MKIRFYTPVIVALVLSACTWVKPTEEAEQVLLVKPYNVQECEKLGSTTSSVKHAIGPIERDEQTVREELVVLAKNEAAAMGADSIVAQGPPQDGRMKFDIYRCND